MNVLRRTYVCTVCCCTLLFLLPYTGATIGMAFLALGGQCDIPVVWDAIKVNAPFMVPVFKLAIGFPFIYHTLAGFRHLYWDRTAKHLELKDVELSSKVLLAASAFLSLILAFTTL